MCKYLSLISFIVLAGCSTVDGVREESKKNNIFTSEEVIASDDFFIFDNVNEQQLSNKKEEQPLPPENENIIQEKNNQEKQLEPNEIAEIKQLEIIQPVMPIDSPAPNDAQVIQYELAAINPQPVKVVEEHKPQPLVHESNQLVINSIEAPLPAELNVTLIEYKEPINFTVNYNESLKEQMDLFLAPFGYKFIWDSKFDVFFENDVTYQSVEMMDILKSIANDLSKMGVDLHINVYLKNKVVLVYSVRS